MQKQHILILHTTTLILAAIIGTTLYPQQQLSAPLKQHHASISTSQSPKINTKTAAVQEFFHCENLTIQDPIAAAKTTNCYELCMKPWKAKCTAVASVLHLNPCSTTSSPQAFSWTDLHPQKNIRNVCFPFITDSALSPNIASMRIKIDTDAATISNVCTFEYRQMRAPDTLSLYGKPNPRDLVYDKMRAEAIRQP